jgi:hypothetical protein
MLPPAASCDRRHDDFDFVTIETMLSCRLSICPGVKSARDLRQRNPEGLRARFDDDVLST